MSAIDTRRALQGVPQDRLPSDYVEKLAGHEGREAEHFAAHDAHPFRMRARHGDQTVAVLHAFGAAEKLGLLAAHHVGGTETQVAGFLARDPEFYGTLCLPGTHTKWVQISAGEIVSFRTVMTGDLFAALSAHTVLKHSIGAGEASHGDDRPAFLEAVADAMARPEAVTARLFSLRAEGLLGELAPATAASRASGLLIGMELAGARGYWLGTRLAVIGDGRLADLYADALSAQGVAVERAGAEETVLDGLRAARSAMAERGDT